jgi:phosphatidate cytidylyltransferase
MTCQLWTALFLLLSSIETASSFTVHPNHAVIPRVNTRSVFSSRLTVAKAKDDFVTNGSPRKAKKKFDQNHSHLYRLVHIYTDYVKRLWVDTNPENRKRIANDKAATLIRQVQKIVKEDDYIEFSDVSDEAREQLVTACDTWLKAVSKSTSAPADTAEAITSLENSATSVLDTSVGAGAVAAGDIESKSAVAKLEPKKKQRSVMFGAAMGLAVAGWVFSGNYLFTGLFTLMTILGQLEYYRLVMNTGVYPARRISIVGACSMFLTALFTPNLHQICLPLFGLWAMVWFLTKRRKVTTIPEIATTFTGMFLLGYVPSFWVRIRLLGGGREPTRLASIAEPVMRFVQQKAETKLPSYIPQMVHLPITTGAIFIFWTWLCLAFSDVGAYFVGKSIGKTKLGTIAPAAGAASPNKTIEGVIGGCALSAMLGMLGAWVQKWPLWALTGAVHGVILGLLGLLGDLTASMLKRDGGLKDFGDILPVRLSRYDCGVCSCLFFLSSQLFRRIASLSHCNCRPTHSNSIRTRYIIYSR